MDEGCEAQGTRWKGLVASLRIRAWGLRARSRALMCPGRSAACQHGAHTTRGDLVTRSCLVAEAHGEVTQDCSAWDGAEISPGTCHCPQDLIHVALMAAGALQCSR